MSMYELFLNFIESICFAVFTANYIKVGRNKLPAYFALFIAGQTTIITITNLILFYEGFFSLIYNGFFFLMMYCFRNKETGPAVGRIIIYIVLLNIIVSVCTELALPVGVFIFKLGNLNSFIASSDYLNIVFFTSRPLIVLLLSIVNSTSRKYRSLTPIFTNWYLGLFLAIFFLMTYLEGFVFSLDDRWLVYICINTVLSMISYFSYHIFNLAAYDHFSHEEQMVIQDEIRLVQKNMQMYEDGEKKLMEMRHNMKNELIIISGYMNKGEYEKSQKYIQETILELNQLPVLISSNHTAVDMIISSKLSKARSFGIDTHATIQLGNISNEAEYDIALILGHLLDNAVENISDEDKYISATIEQNETIVITVQNTTDRNDNVFITNKPNKKAHGFGLMQIRVLAEKYNGGLTIQIADHTCTAVVILSDIA